MHTTTLQFSPPRSIAWTVPKKALVWSAPGKQTRRTGGLKTGPLGGVSFATFSSTSLFRAESGDSRVLLS